MPWNEPNDNPKNKKPQGNAPETPPDLDELWETMTKKWKASWDENGSDKNPSGAFIFVLMFLVIWLLSGIFIVDPAEEAVVKRFGRYIRTVEPGIHWIPRIIESQQTLNVQSLQTITYSAQMLNKDENIVSVEVSVQYRIADPEQYLFNVANPVESLKQATASALRQVIGQTPLDLILTTGRQQVSAEVNVQLQKIMDIYQTGISINDVALQTAKAPDQVKSSFDDAIKAQEDEQRYRNQAQAYQRGVEAIAAGRAQRIINDAQAYQQQVILGARGDAQKFLQLLPEYKRSPQVLRDRLYLDMMESVLTRSSKVMVGVKGNNMFYVPLEKLIAQRRAQLDKSQQAQSQRIGDDISQSQLQSLGRTSSQTTDFGAPSNPFIASPSAKSSELRDGQNARNAALLDSNSNSNSNPNRSSEVNSDSSSDLSLDSSANSDSETDSNINDRLSSSQGDGF